MTNDNTKPSIDVGGRKKRKTPQFSNDVVAAHAYLAIERCC